MTPQTEHNPHAPWRPEGMRDFVAGDRVRVRLSGECRATWMSYSLITNLPTGPKAHHPLEEGRTGKVLRRPFGHPAQREDHPHFVWYDDPMSTGEGLMVGGSYAPNELELLEATR